jgi:AraC-like DNA-binding protein
MAVAGRPLTVNETHGILLHREHRITAASDRLGCVQLDRAIDYMEENIDKPLAPGDVADAVGLSATHFARRFKRAAGSAPHQYLMRCDAALSARVACSPRQTRRLQRLPWRAASLTRNT